MDARQVGYEATKNGVKTHLLNLVREGIDEVMQERKMDSLLMKIT